MTWRGIGGVKRGRLEVVFGERHDWVGVEDFGLFVMLPSVWMKYGRKK